MAHRSQDYGRGRGGGRGGRGRGGHGGGRYQDQGPPEQVTEIGRATHTCQGDLVCMNTSGKVPYFNAFVYQSNKQEVGKIDEIFGGLKDHGFSVKLSTGVKAEKFVGGDTKLFIDPMKMMPIERFTNPTKRGGRGGARGRGGDRGGRGGDRGGRGFSRGGGSRGGSFNQRGGGFNSRGGSFNARGGNRGGRGGFNDRRGGSFQGKRPHGDSSQSFSGKKTKFED
uniref:H/ACA ribonucleoprotein complex subunit n=1 Tax=Steinernema glaseri TaxID=37863 RepID=A0A1I7Y3A4_9BILA